MSKRRGKRNKFSSPPADERWVWLPISLVCSEAWRSRSINCVRVIERLIVENSEHRMLENGNLICTYDQFESFGVTRSRIQAAISEGVVLGLLRVTRGGRYAGSNQPSRYRLTFFATRDGAPPTNEWKAVDKRMARAFQREQNIERELRATWRRNLKNQSPRSTSATTGVR